MKKLLRFRDEEHLEELYWQAVSELEGDSLIVSCEMYIDYANPIMPQKKAQRLWIVTGEAGSRRVTVLKGLGCGLEQAANIVFKTQEHNFINAQRYHLELSFKQVEEPGSPPLE